ncbi:MAG: DUF2779 domain-containing protein [Leptospiraceae bacterium]|nr:DUF2779 domain-containing protein [Leptospiraceae bacterium]
MQSLAEGGFHVGELAKLYFPDGANNDIDALDYETAISQTKELLTQENVVIFEGAIRFKNLFIRADILVKKGDKIQLIEVKAKSFGGQDNTFFFNSSGNSLNSSYRPYLEDVAFQKYVLKGAFPNLQVTSYLMLANKNSTATVDGLNQIFKIQNIKGRKKAVVDYNRIQKQGLGDKLLIQLNADQAIEFIYEERNENGKGFLDEILEYASSYEVDQKIFTPVSAHCKTCEFRATESEVALGKKNGFEECWKTSLHLQDSDFKKPFVFDLWNYRSSNKNIEDGSYFIEDLSEQDFEYDPSESTLSTKHRQWLQVKKVIDNDPTPYLDIQGLQEAMDSFKYPLHFIDFETSAVAIPFFKGMRPYEGIAFQYSHHVITSEGEIKHAGQYLNSTVGEFPNFHFVRSLKKELEQDDGTIFRYATHENSYLNVIYLQLEQSQETDRLELMEWIKTITKSTGTSLVEWTGERLMVDLCDMVKKYYYHPLTNGSNSIKNVLPAILNESEYLKRKYNLPIYGNQIKSLNFLKKVWIEYELDGITIKNPYKLLPKVFENIPIDKLTEDFLLDSSISEVSDGGGALTAYGMIQFTEGFIEVNDALRSALLKYCELDSLAMVMIWEYWNHEINK